MKLLIIQKKLLIFPGGSAVKVTGKLKLTPDGKQPFEIEKHILVVEGTCDEDFHYKKKDILFEYMRDFLIRPNKYFMQSLD